MCHVSHLTDALLGMAALSLAVCVTAGSSTGVACFYTDARSFFHSFPTPLSRTIVVKDASKDNYAKFTTTLRSHPAGQKKKQQLMF